MNENTAKARETFDKVTATGAETVQSLQQGFASAIENARDLNVRLIDMARANTDAAFDFAHEVATVTKASDLVEVWSSHTRKQVDMLTKQANELTTLGQRFASTTAEPVKRATSKAFRGRLSRSLVVATHFS
jgi:hypothetical protein